MVFIGHSMLNIKKGTRASVWTVTSVWPCVFIVNWSGKTKILYSTLRIVFKRCNTSTRKLFINIKFTNNTVSNCTPVCQLTNSPRCVLLSWTWTIYFILTYPMSFVPTENNFVFWKPPIWKWLPPLWIILCLPVRYEISTCVFTFKWLYWQN